VPTVNEVNPSIDQTVRIFDQFYNYSANVPAEEYDAVLSYFKSVFTTVLAAENFTSSLFRVAEETNQSALTLLQTFQQGGQSAPEITVLMAYYLNSVRSPATLLGVLTPTQPNFYAARNVRA
jgi:hypothetical protein